jgi:hypothetical protein
MRFSLKVLNYKGELIYYEYITGLDKLMDRFEILKRIHRNCKGYIKEIEDDYIKMPFKDIAFTY